MTNFALIALCILVGITLRALKLIPENAHRGINTWIIYMAIPAMALKYIPTIQWSTELLLPAVMPLLVWGGSWLLFKLYSLRFPISPATRTALTLTAGLGNTSFVGFPLIQAYYGEHAISIAVISDQVTFVLMATLGSMMAINTGNDKGADIKGALLKLIQFPPFVAFILALVLPRFVSFEAVMPLLDKLAATLVPLALFTVGLQLSFEGWRSEVKLLSVGLAYKLLVAPLIIAAIAVGLHLRGIIPQISVFEAAVAPMITASVIADQYQLNPKLANLMVGIGILIAFVTTGLWWLLLRGFGNPGM